MSSASEMDRRRFIKSSLATVAVAALLGDRALAAPNRRQPNIILINADDLGYADLSCYGSESIRTPNLDSLARRGMRFTSFYASAPVCTPSRAGLMMGRYAVRSGLSYVLFPNDKTGITDSEITVGQVLQKAGYKTACIGKWHLGCTPESHPNRHGFDYYYGLLYSNDMGTMTKQGYPDIPLYRNEEVIERPADQSLLTERYTEEAVKFIRDNKNNPFFIYLPHNMPHWPHHASERFKKRTKAGVYAAAVETIDWGVGEIMKTLRELGLEQNTLVLFMSDNGPVLRPDRPGASAKPLSGAKGNVFEGGQRVPLVAYWPAGIPAGSVCHQPVSNLDMLPTLAAICGGKTPTDRIIDGRNITKLLTNMGKMPDYAFFYNPGKTVPAVRYGKWKLRLEKGRQSVEKPELYNLDLDIGERRNLAKEHPEIVADLKARIDAFLQTL
ncbi:MAG: sulfatase [Armatimonadota bacterium]|nr:sulfatase [Armatimonadota bacterium]